MATRGTYKIVEDGKEVSFYKHWDNYPSGASDFIQLLLNNYKSGSFISFAKEFLTEAVREDCDDVEFDYDFGTEEYNYVLDIPNMSIICYDVEQNEIKIENDLIEFSGSKHTQFRDKYKRSNHKLDII